MSVTDRDQLLRAALDCAGRGWRVFPLRPGDKRPAVPQWEQRATTDTTRIRHCWSAGPYNIGIACGPSGLLIVDCDTPKPDTGPAPQTWALPGVVDGADVLAAQAERSGAAWPLPYTVRTGRGGQHLYFTQPAGQLRNTTGKLGWLIDTRGHGGYVVAAGSTVNGRPYTVMVGGGPEPLPEWIAQLLTASPTPPVRTLPARDASDRRLAPLLRVVLEAREGHRNTRLYWAAKKLFAHAAAGHVDAHAGGQALIDAALHVGLPEREARATVASAYRTVRGPTP